MLEFAVTAVFFCCVLMLVIAALLAPVYVLYQAMQQQWPQWCKTPAWRWSLYCLPGAGLYGWWQHSDTGWLQLTTDLLLGVIASALVLLPITMIWAWYSDPQRREHKNT